MKNALLFLAVSTVIGLSSGLAFGQDTNVPAPTMPTAPAIHPTNPELDDKIINDPSEQNENSAIPPTDGSDDEANAPLHSSDDNENGFDQNNSYDDDQSPTPPTDMNPSSNQPTDSESEGYDQD